MMKKVEAHNEDQKSFILHLNDFHAIMLYLTKFEKESQELPIDLKTRLFDIQNNLIEEIIESTKIGPMQKTRNIPIENYVRFFNVIGRSNRLGRKNFFSLVSTFN